MVERIQADPTCPGEVAPSSRGRARALPRLVLGALDQRKVRACL
jgi:hypothetical protein